MSLPFTSRQFFEVFAAYNIAVWPAQVFLNLAALLALWWITLNRTSANRRVAMILVLLWVWMAVAYHFAFFASINKAAWAFGVLFMVGAAVFVWEGVVKGRLHFTAPHDRRGWAGLVLIGYSMLVYPLLGSLFGHAYPATPTFGLPCPTTIFTIGVLMQARRPAPLRVFIVPILWSLIGSFAVFGLGVYQDAGLLVAAAAAVVAALPGTASRQASS